MAVPDDKISPEKAKCIDISYPNRTGFTFLGLEYEGIPENLILNLFGWMILLLFFAVMRKRAWDYGRLALMHKENNRWTRLFYGTLDESTGVEDEIPISPTDSAITLDHGLFSWIFATFRIKDEHILTKCGLDSVQYLSFQRNVTLLLGIITLVSLGIVLPINFTGNVFGDHSYFSFGHTTVGNLKPDSHWLWIHITIAILYLPLTVAIMRRFSLKLQPEIIDSVSRTLMIADIPRRYCDVNDLIRHFKSAYPEYEVQNIQLAYDITKVSKLDQERDAAHQAKVYCENYFKDTGKKLTARPFICGYVLSCCGNLVTSSVDAIDYYTAEEERLLAEIEAAKSKSLMKPLGIAFVTMGSFEATKRIYEDHKYDIKKCAAHPRTSTVSSLLQPHLWTVKFAPPPEDIFWENLRESSTNRTWKTTLINTFLVVILFFFSTPPIVLVTFEKLQLGKLKYINPILSDTVPTLLLWSFAALLPAVVIKSDQWLNHWTRSERNHAIMRKTFIFLLFMVMILPSLGLASIEAFLDFALKKQTDESYRWRCLFLPDKGAFFVNYVITASFIGTGLELIRFPELFLYASRVFLSRSRADTVSARKLVLWEFPFGVHYAWMLLIFALTVVYSLACPIITIFGLVYMLIKHFVDKYNIYFAYGPSKIKRRIHATAINFVIASVVLLQASFLLLVILRKGINEITVYTIIGFIVTISFAFAQCFLRSCESWGPIHYQTAKSRAAESPRKRDLHSQFQYIPDVLRRNLGVPVYRNNDLTPQTATASYASLDLVDAQIEINSFANQTDERDTTVLYPSHTDGSACV